MSTKATLVRALVAASALAAGCGGGGGSTGGSSNGGSGGNSSFDACSLVTQTDASAIFGHPATKETGTPVTDQHMRGECLWGYDDGAVSHLMEFRGFDQEAYYSAPTDSVPFTIGDGGYTRENPIAGVDIGWLQSGWTLSLSYGTAGNNAPDPAAKLDEMKALAQKASAGFAP